MTMNKHTNTLVLLLAASVLLSLLYIPQFNILQGDKEIYRYIGLVMQKGGVPYRDVFDHKPPLIFFLNYAALLMGGDWGLWIIDALLTLLATALFFQLGRKYKLPYPWLLPLLFNLMLRNFLICLGMGMTREYTTIFLLFFFCVLLGKYRYRYYLLGLLAGLIFFMQQDQVFPLIPLFAYALLPREDRLPIFARIGRAAAGFVTVAIPIILYFAFHNSLWYFWQDAFHFNFTWYTTTLKASVWDHFRKLKLVLDQGNYELPFMVAVTLGLSAVVFRATNKTLIFVCLASMALSLSPGFMGGRDIIPDHGMTFTHYYLPLAASLCFVLFAVFVCSAEPFIQSRKAQAIFGIIMCVSLVYTNLQHATHLTPVTRHEVLRSPELKYLRQHKPGDYQLFELGYNDYVYVYNTLGIIGPSKWVYQHFWVLYNNWDTDHMELRGIEEDLLRHKTTYVMDFARPGQFFRDPSAYASWHGFLQEHYDTIALPGQHESTLWKLKGTPE